MNAVNEGVDRVQELNLRSRLLCRRYLVAVFRSVDVAVPTSPGSWVSIHWGFGCSRDKEFELLGAWGQTGADAPLSPELVADLESRGVERIRCLVSNPLAVRDSKRGDELLGMSALPSIAQAMAVSAAMAAPRHRQAVASALQLVVGASGSAVASLVLSDFECGPWGQKYPQIVALWRLALVHWQPLFDLPASSRRVVLSGDRMATETHGTLERAIARHGSFANSAEALEFVCGVLLRAERRLERAASSAAAVRRYGALCLAGASKSQGSAVAGFI